MFSFTPPTWPREPPKLSDRRGHELLDVNIENKSPLPPYTDLREFIISSDKFPIDFPVDTARCKTLEKNVANATLLRNINSAYPIIHECVLPLFTDFILHKRLFGSDIEKQLYEKMSFLDLIDRLLKRGAVTFMDEIDYYVLLDGTEGKGQWETIGTANENGALNLQNCLSYDEIKLAAFLSVSSFSYFINSGSVCNEGVIANDREKLQEEGVIIGLVGALVGARLGIHYYMQHEEVVHEMLDVESDEATFPPTMASLFAGFYGKPNSTYYQYLVTRVDNTYTTKNMYLDNITHSKRIAISIDTLLFEANYRARQRNTTAFVHVDIGLGILRYTYNKQLVFMETFIRRIEFWGNRLSHIDDVFFEYFPGISKLRLTRCGKYANGSIIPIQGHPKEGIRVSLSPRAPHQSLTIAIGDDEVHPEPEQLLVVSYPLDGNALPGNEYWNGHLSCWTTSAADRCWKRHYPGQHKRQRRICDAITPLVNDYWEANLSCSRNCAAACSSQIAEIHNAHINRNVCARNLKVAAQGTIYAYDDYIIKANRKPEEIGDKWNTCVMA